MSDTLLTNVAPLGWEHISLTGDYLSSEIDEPRERFRQLRTAIPIVAPSAYARENTPR